MLGLSKEMIAMFAKFNSVNVLAHLTGLETIEKHASEIHSSISGTSNPTII